MSSSTLSRGRTHITRSHANVGNVVHEAGENIEYVHLSVLKGVLLDETGDDAVIVNQNVNQNEVRKVQLRVLIGEDDAALYFDIDSDNGKETHLANNLCLNPYEKVCISSSNPKTNLVINGVVTRKPVIC